MPVYFHTEAPLVFSLPQKMLHKRWLAAVAVAESGGERTIESLNYIFCNDDSLHRINVEYLQHDTLTDVITFDNGFDLTRIVGDVFVSVERTNDNAATYAVPPLDELRRVMVHGLLHLLGYTDKTDADSQLMRTKENDYLLLYEQMRAAK